MMSLFYDSKESVCVCVDTDPTAIIIGFLYVLHQQMKSLKGKALFSSFLYPLILALIMALSGYWIQFLKTIE